jgi:hypothetical protein
VVDFPARTHSPSLKKILEITDFFRYLTEFL